MDSFPIEFSHTGEGDQQESNNNEILAPDSPLIVVVTGAAGHEAYSILHEIANGDVFGKRQPIELHLLDVPPLAGILNGVAMELADCALPLLQQVVTTTDPAVAFERASAAFLIGTMPPQPGMAERDLFTGNLLIFKQLGEALDQHADRNVKVLVVGSPANENAQVCAHFAPSIPRANITAMSRLVQNRACKFIADKLDVVPVPEVRNVIVWGNSRRESQLLDVRHATVRIGGENREQSVYDAVNDAGYLEGEFVETVQGRESCLVALRKMSSAMSTAKAACDHMRDWWTGTAKGEMVSMGVVSDGKSYDVATGVVFSMPVMIVAKQWSVVKDLRLDEKTRAELKRVSDEMLRHIDEIKKITIDLCL